MRVFTWTPGVALGMRRLSIIDLATGHQPIHNEDRTVWVVFNGEIYNYRRLRRELESRGHRFYTPSDTETIVHAYEQWGDDAFRRLRGMFGIALWDARQRPLLLARDRLGHQAAALRRCRIGGCISGREIKSLLAGRRRRPRARSRGARSLPLVPLHAARRVDLQRHSQAAARAFPALAGRPRRPSAATGQCRREETLAAVAKRTRRRRCAPSCADAVESHLMSEVPLGAFLSGGVDSSVVVGLMAQASSRPVKTFSIGFDDPRVRRAGARARRRAALRHRSPRVRRPARCARDHRRPDRALR